MFVMVIPKCVTYKVIQRDRIIQKIVRYYKTRVGEFRGNNWDNLKRKMWKKYLRTSLGVTYKIIWNL